MSKKKRLKQQEAKKKKEEMKNVVRKEKCLRCGKPMVKNHKSCKACSKKDRLKGKANKRGKPKSYYLNS